MLDKSQLMMLRNRKLNITGLFPSERDRERERKREKERETSAEKITHGRLNLYSSRNINLLTPWS